MLVPLLLAVSCFSAQGSEQQNKMVGGYYPNLLPNSTDLWESKCMRAMCIQESDCLSPVALCERNNGFAKGYHLDEGDEACGWYQIHWPYYQDCAYLNLYSKAHDHWRDCARDHDCASRCVRHYWLRYRSTCPEEMDQCECMGRIHNGGPMGPHRRNKTDYYWSRMKTHLPY